jgi:hydrogenase small subunit
VGTCVEEIALEKERSVIDTWSRLYGFQEEDIRKAMKKTRTPVLWINGLDCTGCMESFLRGISSTTELLLDWISLEYSELLSSASGHQAESHKGRISEEYDGKFVLVIEGAIPLKDEYLTVAGKSVREEIIATAQKAKAVLAFGSCSAWGGLPAAKPNPTESVSIRELVPNVPVVLVPGCPPIADVMIGTLLHLAIYGEIPELDNKGRPKRFYRQTVHQVCHRKPFFDKGLFAESYDDEKSLKGYCLFKLGCKGPSTFNACETLGWNGMRTSPIGAGFACIGCSEKNFWDKGPLCHRKVRAGAKIKAKAR